MYLPGACPVGHPVSLLDGCRSVPSVLTLIQRSVRRYASSMRFSKLSLTHDCECLGLATLCYINSCQHGAMQIALSTAQ
jgi:hypothetical protein